MIALIALLTFILGSAIGYYGQMVYTKLSAIYDLHKDRIEAKNVGVVKIRGIPVQNNDPIDLSSDTGPVMRPKPGIIETERQIERDTILRESHK